RRGLAIDSTVDIFTFYVPHRHVYGEQWIKFMKDGVNATPLPTVNTTGYIDHAAFLGTINPDTNKIPKHLFRSEERFSRNAETDLVCRLLLEKKKRHQQCIILQLARHAFQLVGAPRPSHPRFYHIADI